MIFTKIVLDDWVNEEIKEYLLIQEGITDVSISFKKFLTILNIEYNNKVTPEIIIKYIELLQEKNYPILFEFDKGNINNYKKMKYLIHDMCCEYCYKGLVKDLFENKKIKSVKSNFDFYKPAYDIELTIEYSDDYSENEVIEYIKDENI